MKRLVIFACLLVLVGGIMGWVVKWISLQPPFITPDELGQYGYFFWFAESFSLIIWPTLLIGPYESVYGETVVLIVSLLANITLYALGSLMLFLFRRRANRLVLSLTVFPIPFVGFSIFLFGLARVFHQPVPYALAVAYFVVLSILLFEVFGKMDHMRDLH